MRIRIHVRLIRLAIATLAATAVTVSLFVGALRSSAAQNPTLAMDMAPDDNTYDETTNTMILGAIDDCLSTPAPGNDGTHAHPVHVVTQNVEDLVGWQVRLNYIGDQMRPSTVNFTPFADYTTGQNISFVNLPIDQAAAVHRDLLTAASIPPAAAGPQTAAFGSVYIAAQNFPVSPDTPLNPSRTTPLIARPAAASSPPSPRRSSPATPATPLSSSTWTTATLTSRAAASPSSTAPPPRMSSFRPPPSATATMVRARPARRSTARLPSAQW